MMSTTRIAIIGFGKIARDQHVPAILANNSFALAAVVSRHPVPDVDVPVYTDHHQLLHHADQFDAVAICTPPGPRHAIARDCLDAGLCTLLEKPPAATLGEAEDLVRLATLSGSTLFATWHAQFNGAVVEAAAIIRREGLAAMRIEWLEDVEKWHPGQDWIWRPGGFGVFDAGINALSIATCLAPDPLLLESADLSYDDDRQAPAAARLRMHSRNATGPIEALLDWRYKGPERWRIYITTGAGRNLVLDQGGAALIIDGKPAPETPHAEYPAIYARFATLIAERRSQADLEPLRIVADAFLVGSRNRVP